jgi:hypothetical protein
MNGVCYQMFKSSGMLLTVGLQMDTDLSEQPSTSTVCTKKYGVCFITALRTSNLAVIVTLFTAYINSVYTRMPNLKTNLKVKLEIEYCLLGCGAVYSGTKLLVFRREVLLYSSAYN